VQREVQENSVQKAMSMILVSGFALVSLISCKPKAGITQDEMVRRAQELFDAVTAGDQTPAKKYYAEDCMFFDEKGRNMNKAALVADITPLPTGFSGSIAIGKVQSHIEGYVAILSYDLDEKETIYGQNLTARYHETDTWLRRDGNWQIIAGQVLRYYEDPAPGKANVAKYAEYAGTYELAPTVTLVVSKDGDQLYRQRSEHPKELLVPEASDIFFRKGVEGRIVFGHGDNGRVDALIDRRNNEDVVWKKVK
jgi:ketosteroid isomerase-like protein